MSVAHVTPPAAGSRPEAASGPHRTPPVNWFALIGGVVLVFQAFVMIKWVSGSRFEPVPAGVSDPPTWMKAVLISWQAIGVPLALALLYFVLIRPWRRDGRPTFDGLALVAYFLVAFQDPLSCYFQQWFTYNAYLVNLGSWVNDVPGWMPFGAPGAMMVEPILWIGPTYLYVFYAVSLVGCWAMRTAHARFPQLGTMGLVLVCWGAAMVFDLMLEGFVIMPLGFYEYQGGSTLALFPDSYHRFPLHEAPIAGAIFAGFGVLRYFKDDQGRTVAERGVDKLNVSGRRKNLLRFLAIFGMVNVMYLLAYNLPNALIGAHSTTWSKDLQERSYFLNGICGEGTGRACPGPGVPLVRGNQSPYVGTDGRLHVPAGGTPPPPTVPLQDGKRGPFKGPIF